VEGVVVVEEAPDESVQNWAMMLDPGWQPRHPDEEPPPEAMVGGWRLDEKGNAGPFEPNPGYLPSSADSPTDPADAVLRLVAEGRESVDSVLPVIGDALLEVAAEDGWPLVGPAPDGAPCVAVVTAPAHRQRVDAAEWYQLTSAQLLEALPPDTDILLNPGAPGSMRLLASALRDRLTS
jgi:hypothetical protein